MEFGFSKGEYSPEEFSKFLADQMSPTISVAANFVFGILHPLFLYRAAIRKGNDPVARAALHKASIIFFGANHPKYQKLYARDLFYQLKTEGYEGAGFIQRNGASWIESEFSQGFDALNEERNYFLKDWCIYQGVPTKEQWLTASLSLNAFLNVSYLTSYFKTQVRFTSGF
jgi:hypothetical protein